MKFVNWGSLSAVAFFSISTSVQAEVVYPLEIKNGNKIKSALVTKINDNQFITDPELFDEKSSLFIVDKSVTPVAKILAVVSYKDEKHRIAVLTASNVKGNAVAFSNKAQPLGGQLVLLTPEGQTPSMVQQYGVVKSLFSGDLYTHGALYKEGQWAAPLLNNCKELVGVSLAETASFGSVKLPTSLAYANSAEQIKTILTSQKISFTTAKEVCLSDVEQANKKLADLEKQNSEIKKTNDELEKAKKDLEVKVDKSKEDLDKANKQRADEVAKTNEKVEEKDKEIKESEEQIKKAEEERKRIELEKQQAEQKAKEEAEQKLQAQTQQYYIVAGAVFVLVLLALIFVVVLRSRKQTLQQQQVELERKAKEASGLASAKQKLEVERQHLKDELHQKNKAFANILLDGQTREGRRIRLNINGAAMVQKGVAIIGREAAQVDCALTEPEISRWHLRLFVENNQLWADDMQSQNGSWINEIQLEHGKPQLLPEGAVLRLSSVSFRVIYLTGDSAV